MKSFKETLINHRFQDKTNSPTISVIVFGKVQKSAQIYYSNKSSKY